MKNFNGNSWLQLLLKQMGKNSLSIIFIIVVYLMLWVIPQISDLIMVITQSQSHWFVVSVFFVILSVFAFLISAVNDYIYPRIPENLKVKLKDEELEAFNKEQSKLFKNPKDEKEVFINLRDSEDNHITDEDYEETTESYLKRMFPKVLGTILILIAAFSIRRASIAVYGDTLDILSNTWLLMFIAVLILITNKKISDFLMRIFGFVLKIQLLPLIIAVTCLIAIVIFGLFNQGGSSRDIEFLFYSLLLLALLFFIVSTSYNKYILWLKKYAFKLIISLTIFIVACYLYLFINPSGLKVVTPLSIVFICLIGLYTFMNVLRYFSARYKRFPSLTLVLVILMILTIRTTSSNDFDHYKASNVRTVIRVSDRISLDEYIKVWVFNRYQDVKDSSVDKPFPIILVSSEGGGSRAGLWTFLVQSHLFDQNKHYFKKHLFSLSGASGGGVGNNLFYTQAYNITKGKNSTSLRYKTPQNDFNFRASTIYNGEGDQNRGDYLSSSLASLLGRDSFVSITGLFSRSFPDRGALLEDEWERSFAGTFDCSVDESLGAPYLAMRPTLTDSDRLYLQQPDTITTMANSNSYIIPLLITNVTHLQSGQRFVISPVDMSNSKFNMNVFPDFLKIYSDRIGPSTMIKRSTAMSTNARFPYVSPVTRVMDSVGQFGDAAYYNNVGGSVTLRLQKALEEKLSNYPELAGKYSVRQLTVTNKSKPSFSYSSQLLAPLSMITKATLAHPKESWNSFDNDYRIQSMETTIKNEDGQNIKPFIPLGRYLSKNTVLSLEQRLENIKDSINLILE